MLIKTTASLNLVSSPGESNLFEVTLRVDVTLSYYVPNEHTLKSALKGIPYALLIPLNPDINNPVDYSGKSTITGINPSDLLKQMEDLRWTIVEYLKALHWATNPLTVNYEIESCHQCSRRSPSLD